MRKYSITDITRELADGRLLYRIVALCDFGPIRKGDLGGFVEHSGNLSQRGLCWIGGNAAALEDSKVTCDALLTDHAIIRDGVYVTGESHVGESVELVEHVFVAGHAVLLGSTFVAGSVSILDHARLSCQAHMSRSKKTVHPNVGDYARISDHACLEGRISIMDESEINGFAIVRGNVRMRERAKATDNALVEGLVTLSGNARALQNCRIRGRSVVTNDAIVAGRSLVEGKSLVTGRACMIGSSYLKDGVLSGDEYMSTGCDGQLLVRNLPAWRSLYGI